MKLYQIFTIAAIMVATATQAQHKHSNIGIKGGLNYYNLVNENSNTGASIIGFHVGLMSHIHLNEQFALQPEIVFSTQGSEFEPNGAKTNLNLNYINVPLILQYMFDNGFRLQAGPQVGFLLNAETDVVNTEFDRREDFKNTDLGVSLGVGYINPASNFGVDARYNIGLSDINENNSVNSYNRGYQVGVFYLFNHN